MPKEERWVIIRDLQKRYQKGIVEASRDALKAEAGARLTRLRLKKDKHIRLCAMALKRYGGYVQVVPCRTVADLEALRARHADDLKACGTRPGSAPHLQGQGGGPTGSDNSEVVVARLMAELRTVVARALPRDPPPPVPYPNRSAHPAPARAAVAFHMKHLKAISAALVALVEITEEGALKAPPSDRFLQVAGGGGNAKGKGIGHEAAARPSCCAGCSRGRGVLRERRRLEGPRRGLGRRQREQDLWYCDVEMAADGDLSEDETGFARTEGLDLGP